MANWGDSILLTVDEIRSIGEYVQPPAITGLPYTDEDFNGNYLHAGSAVGPFTLNEASAKEHGLVATDLAMCLRVPPVNADTCYADCDWRGVNCEHRNNVGIYGPHPAHTHESWVGSGGAAAPDAAGAFAVSAAGTPALDLALNSWYETRLADVPNQNFPSGVDGPPLIYWYRKADVWSAYYGAALPKGGTWAHPWEGVYCWLGWAFLRLKFPTVAANNTLTVTVTSRTYTFGDVHVNDSTRQTNFTYMATAHTHTYAVDVTPGTTNYDLCLMTPDENEHPRFERVVSVVISGFEDGDWVIGEPDLILDTSVATHAALKTFEGYEYQKGGASAHVDAAHLALYAGDYDLCNFAEDTVPFFDRVTGAVSGLDLTVAWTLTDFANILGWVDDAWTASLNTANYEAACKDNETPQNTLTTCWAFNLCYPDAEAPGTPLEQDADGTTVNCAIRCKQWNIVTGIKYRVLPDKVVEGKIHGRAMATATTLARSTTLPDKLWRRPEGSGPWQLVQTITSDDKGHWGSGTCEQFYDYDGDTPLWWEYGIGVTEADIEVVERVYTREYVAQDADGTALTPVMPHLAEGHISDRYLWFVSSSQIYCQRQPTAAMTWTPPKAVVAGYYPWGDQLPTGELVMCYQTPASQIAWRRSLDDNGTWGAYGVPVTGLYPYAIEYNNIQYLVSYTSGVGQVIRRSQNWFSTQLTFTGAATSALITADTNAERVGALKADSDGRRLVCAVPSGNNINFFQSKDDGETWVSV